ncbi:hypothetical protein CVT26_013333 [Gymnopilus dilepis]|uniref:Uncharacterized protein n=1 Tax=Gymnopilus dilepis TaxID=231916 RepID=A0A409YF10_9AGAR|nr:hypothetical protein CVT26_013333 [Gymnopilus dilepis]
MPIIKNVRTIVVQEINLLTAFSWRDHSASTIVGAIVSLGAMLNASRAQAHIVPNILSGYLFLIPWLTSYLYFFNLSNQIVGVEEDRINKPDRPIPSGNVTIRGARVRQAISFGVFLALGLARPRLLPETLVWMLTTAFLCHTKAGNHWAGKNSIAMPIGGWALLSGSWKAVALMKPNPIVHHQMVALCLWGGLLTHIQDLRDVEGDRVVGRKTLPIAFGEERSRRIIVFLLSPFAIVALWMGDVLQTAPLTVLGLHAFLGWRVLRGKDARYDHKTYMVSWHPLHQK